MGAGAKGTADAWRCSLIQIYLPFASAADTVATCVGDGGGWGHRLG